MKKLITILLALLLVASFVSAKAGDTDKTKAVPNLINEKEQMVGNDKDGHGCIGSAGYSWDKEKQKCVRPWEENKTKIQKKIQKHNGTIKGNQTQKREKLMSGLENALSRVKNENARARIQSNLERFQEKVQARLSKLENVSVEEINNKTGAMKLKAKEKVKFLGFIKGKATKRFNINAEGKIEEHAPWYRFLYAVEKTENNKE